METKRGIVSESNIVTSIRLPREQHRQLKAMAASEHRSVSQQVRYLIERYVEDTAMEAA